ncbi:hypothetical protein C0989_012545 [Termitomyces sp. Mn162]|nr:hypothetical protein C0989_012545 [Termitomyces sp. Mn162]
MAFVVVIGVLSVLGFIFGIYSGIRSGIIRESRTGFRKTDTIINRLIRGAIQTGLFASMFALADLFSFVLHGDTNLYAMFAYPIGRIYTNTLLDTLNARIELKLMNASTMDVDEEVRLLYIEIGCSSFNYRQQMLSIAKDTVTRQSPVRSVEKFPGETDVYTSNKV